MIQISIEPTVRVRVKLAVLCVVSVLAVSACASQQADGGAVSSDRAKVYLVDQGPVPGQSSGFWDGLDGAYANWRPWGGSPEDSSGYFWLAADDVNLYYRAVITDSSPQANTQPNQDTWNGTSIEVFFGTKSVYHVAFEGVDCQVRFWVPSLDAQPLPVKAMRNGIELTDRQFTGWAEYSETGYIIEAAVSLEALEITKPFKIGQHIRCDFRINHAAPGSGRDIFCNWHAEGDTAHNDASTWGNGTITARP
jgi:hypothetical protein